MLLFALGLLAKAPELVLPIGPDQGTYTYVAERILDGQVPYRDAWDNKPPGTYYAHAAVLGVLPADRWARSCIPGLAQPCGYVALQLVDLVWTALTAVALYALAFRISAVRHVGVLAAGIFFLFANLSQVSQEGSTPEKQLLLPMALAYLAYLKFRRDGGSAWMALCGFSAAVAFLFKQTAISIPLAVLLVAVWELTAVRRTARVVTAARALKAAGLFAVGFAVPLVLVSLYLASRGALAAFWEAAFVYNVGQAGTGLLAVPRGMLAGAWQVFSRSSALLWLLAVAGACAVLAPPGRARSSGARLALAWAAADAASLALGGSKFAQVYFVQLVPSLAVLAAIGVHYAWGRTAHALAWRWYAVTVAAGVFLLSNPQQAQVSLRAWNERVPPRSSVPAEQANVGPFRDLARAGPLFVWGDASQLYALAGAASPSRFFHAFPLSRVFSGDAGYLARRQELLAAFRVNPPVAILVDPRTERDDPDGSKGLRLDSFPELLQLIERAYRPMDQRNLAGGWTAFVRQ